ncbi:flagellar assembly protein FliW [Crassaminicella thermophila]|uniref:Flagellar assembly factor FliW n=1 Tax=Crassaminicella thermophila TaxID=2599308 RepID=A0A5C0SEA9_CRATE|nr:flagellar assembly protein FliW [Crassaminicella thermophila]QEK11309.1 flagellar assembly protein FliW [Crassaminicella thermophila]
MILNTKHFGKIEIDEEKIITFEEGLLGFEAIKKYTVIMNPDKEVPFHWLQAVEEPDLAFVITNPFLFKKDYDFYIPERIVDELEIQKEEDVMIFSIAVVPKELKNMTINLRGPLIINTNNKKGKQIVLDTDKYPLKYYIFEENR